MSDQTSQQQKGKAALEFVKRHKGKAAATAAIGGGALLYAMTTCWSPGCWPGYYQIPGQSYCTKCP